MRFAKEWVFDWRVPTELRGINRHGLEAVSTDDWSDGPTLVETPTTFDTDVPPPAPVKNPPSAVGGAQVNPSARPSARCGPSKIPD